MKVYIKSSYSDEYPEEYDDVFNGHKYRIDGGYDIKYADTPVKAIQIWFQLSKKNPMDASIMAKTRADAIYLCNQAKPEVISKMYDRYGSPYKLDYLIDSVTNQVETGCKDFYENKYGYGDQIHPFCYG